MENYCEPIQVVAKVYLTDNSYDLIFSIYLSIYLSIDSLLRRLIILFLSFPYRIDRQLLLRYNAMINIPGKATEPHVLRSVWYAA